MIRRSFQALDTSWLKLELVAARNLIMIVNCSRWATAFSAANALSICKSHNPIVLIILRMAQSSEFFNYSLDEQSTKKVS
jgi:hypothetical protein